MRIFRTNSVSISLVRRLQWKSAIPSRTPNRGGRIEERRDRLHAGLTAIYGWYERNAALAACVMRDVEYHAVTQQIVGLRFGPFMASYREVLGSGAGPKQSADFCLAMSFFTWRTLVRDARPDDDRSR